MMRTANLLGITALVLLVVGCSSSEPSGAGAVGAGGTLGGGGSSNTAGGSALGGNLGTGGQSEGGAPGQGGAVTPLGGAPGNGGLTGSGGTEQSGGAPGSGGLQGSGGSSGAGGTDPIEPGVWNGYIASDAAAAIPSEYATWKNNYFRACGDGLTAGIWNGGGVFSEGIGYGMLITANAGSQADFDAVYQFYQRAEKSAAGLLNWTCNFDQNACSLSCSGNGATDADLDIAAALLMAAKRWGGTYREAARALIVTLRTAVVESCGTILDIRPGDVWGGCTDPGNGLINPSYYSPGYYRAFAQVDSEGAATWNQLVEDTYPLWSLGWKGHPDRMFLWPDAQKWNGTTFVNDKGFAYNGYDACRVPWRIATDYAWTGESRAQSLLGQIGGEIDTAGITTNSLGGPAYPMNSAFIGSMALAGIAISQAKADEYYAAWMGVNKDDTPYYQGTLRMLYLLVAGGQFISPLE